MSALIIAAALHFAFSQASAAEKSSEFPSSPPIESIIRNGLAKSFKDPDSALIKVTRWPRLATAKTADTEYSGWLACAEINAKNSYGAYTGYEHYFIAIDPKTFDAVAVPRLTRSGGNINAWRAECYLKHDDDPPSPSPQ